ncbi:TRAP-type C4-dicarboxylate transport system substrate-binding protein [Chryseomicrobium aureum]|uniref:TRAP transporter substrate-binding protein DctP n=1 Tax=Chryseomicrobium aureum TaxID=1441723 RepID=UPI0019579A49|nr:TRAP transporter substrate-binding protein DctP [Chryseomicrobium aureum]MBM7707171.1 TRAP-type C4-dicarboxylate transport system substrate-binding protein [Chryseomicrobium aureum]
MKWTGGKFLAVTAMAGILLAACGDGETTSGTTGGSDSAETITLRAATGLSPQHAWWEGGMVPWMERVEELTDGQVEFETFTSGELVAVPDEAEAVENGTVDVALILPIYQPDQFPMAEITMLPLNHSDTMIASNAWKALLESDQELQDGQTFSELQFSQFKIFPISTTQEYSISTTGKEFNSVNDVIGTSLRTPSRIHEMYAAEAQLNSVTMPAVEMYDALSRGTFDGSFYSIADWTGYGFQDLFKYTVTGINFGHFNSFIGMNKEKFESLPANVQEAMEQATEEYFEGSGQIWLDRSEAVITMNEEAGGQFVDFSTLPQDVQDHFNQGVENTWTNYAQLLEDNGLPGTELIKLWRDLLVENGGEVPESVMNLE